MKVVLFGGTGMIGQGALRACLADERVTRVLAVGRRPIALEHPKLDQLTVEDFTDLGPVEDRLTGFDACFYCLGISSAGMTEADYTRVTYDYAMAAGTTLARLNPSMAFVFISGVGADPTERSRMFWARVKGRTENALAKLPFRAVYNVRPGYVQPVGGVTSRTAMYRAFYTVFGALYPLARAIAPSQVTDNDTLGRALVAVVAEGGPSRIVGMPEVNRLGRSAP